ncbi:unnamed protein product [Fusarium venenatum]|uniref:Uncharacterized protein n=1 Tax=Fusarium venenatum TaxID=56646 RepID=A0A2L2TB47_9HYPO|nr:uncharacterized protein FVRRES_03790 [Fusarium venenatum]CEI67278.1 unnamed protein product [Fusarium venenatum]
MKPTIFLSLITLPFTLAGTINKAKASSPDLIASIAEFRSIFDPESSVILPRQDKGRKCEDLEGWKRCRLSVKLC